MLKSELARELSIDASVMSKRCRDYLAAAGKTDERYLDDETVGHLRAAHQLVTSHAARTWGEAVDRVLGNYTEPVPAKSAQDIVQRLDRLEASLTKVGEEVAWIATYLRERSERQGSPKSTSQAFVGTPPEPRPNS